MEFVNLHRFCLVCLSSDRNLYPIQDLTFFASLTLLKLSEAGAFALCWECDRIVKNAMLFRRKALKAQAVLNGRELASTTLSNIGQRNLVNITDIPPQPLSEDTNLIEDEPVIKTECLISFDPLDTEDTGCNVTNDDVKEEYSSSSDDETLSDSRKGNIGYVEIDASHQLAPKEKLNVEPVPKLQFVPILPKPGQSTEPKTFIIEPLTPNKKDATTTPLHKTVADNDSHINEHSKSADAFPCKICGRSFKSEVELRAHTCTHYRVFECELCKEECVSHLELVKHYDSRHQDVRYKCKQCDERFPTRKAAWLHKRRQHVGKVPCAECHKMIRADIVKTHMEIHKVHPPAQCDVCQKTYNGNRRLLLHKKWVHSVQGTEDTDEVAYCVPCDIEFKQLSNYKLHLERSPKHANKEDLQKCPHCDKQFSCAKYLEGHIRRTHSEINFNCDQCPRKFVYAGRLRQHIRKVHEKVVPPRNKVCDICGKAFFSGVVLRQHMNSHNNIRPFVCEYCGDTFSYSGARYTHIRLKHKNNKTETENNKTEAVNNKTKTVNNKAKTVNNKTKTVNKKTKTKNNKKKKVE